MIPAWPTRTGRPADTDGFAWGSLFGMEEASARHSVEAGLEEALDAGRFEPGGQAWRRKRADITAELPDQPPGQYVDSPSRRPMM